MPKKRHSHMDRSRPIEPTSQPNVIVPREMTIRRVPLDGSPPRVAHNIAWTRVGGQILLEVGHFDLFALNKLMQEESKRDTPSEELSIDWFISDRFVLDFDSAERLVNVAKLLDQELLRIRQAFIEETTR